MNDRVDHEPQVSAGAAPHDSATPIPARSTEEIAERGGPGVFRHDRVTLLPRRRGGSIRYADVVHIATTARAIVVGMAHDTVVLRRRDFVDEQAMRAFTIALRERIAALPSGEQRLARMAVLDRRLRERRPRRAVPLFVVACLVVFAVQWGDPFVAHVGAFMPDLVVAGELWRVVSANFLHEATAFPVHLALNLICIALLGALVERVLGSWRAAVVMGVAALGAMLGCVIAGYASTVGASGVAAGLAGALLCLELKGSRQLPALWRIPRRAFVLALLAQAVLDWFVPFIAGAAHLGGFLAGYAVTRLLVGPALVERAPGRLVRIVATAFAAATVAAAIATAPLIRRDPAALERHALRVLRDDHPSAGDDNTVAWVLVTESEPSELGVQLAAALAERAVAATERSDPDLLDTLAEVLFVLGDLPGALIAIDEAIELSGGERYFVEQRRRFIGERDPADRPAPPTQPWTGRPRLDGPPERDPRDDGDDMLQGEEGVVI